MNKRNLAKALLAAKNKEAGEDPAEERGETAAQETKEDKGGTLQMTGQNSEQGLPNPKKPSAAHPTKGRGAFFPNTVKHPKGKAGKPVAGAKKPAGAIYFPKAKTRGA